MANEDIRQILYFPHLHCYIESMIYEYHNYRSFLKNTLAEKAKVKDGYSLSAFAGRIKVSKSFLSEVLNEKKSLSVELAFKIALKLDLTETELQYFCLLVQLEQEKDPEFRSELAKRLSALNPERKTHDLSVDIFKAIADWYHYAILEMTYLAGVSMDSSTIAKKLGITKIEAELGLERLLRLELIEKKDNKYKKTHAYVLTKSAVPNAALRQLHRQILEKALESLETQTPKQRMSATDIVPIDSKYLADVDKLSHEFSAAVIKLSEKSKVKDNIYALSVHFFNLTESKEKKQ